MGHCSAASSLSSSTVEKNPGPLPEEETLPLGGGDGELHVSLQKAHGSPTHDLTSIGYKSREKEPTLTSGARIKRISTTSRSAEAEQAPGSKKAVDVAYRSRHGNGIISCSGEKLDATASGTRIVMEGTRSRSAEAKQIERVGAIGFRSDEADALLVMNSIEVLVRVGIIHLKLGTDRKVDSY